MNARMSDPTAVAAASTNAMNPARPNIGAPVRFEAMTPRNPTPTRRIALVAVLLFTGASCAGRVLVGLIIARARARSKCYMGFSSACVPGWVVPFG